MSGTGPPLVSVIVPAYNAERHVAAALTSVLNQTYLGYEVIVVDDGSTDGTGAAVLKMTGPIVYIRQANQGPAVARNAGLRAARGALICFLDADDTWVADKLAIQVAFMDANPVVSLLFADAEEFDDGGVRFPSLLSTSYFHSEIEDGVPIADAFGKLLEENFIPTSTVMARRECFSGEGLFDEALRGPEDRDMWSRIAVHHSVAALRRILGRKRIVAASVSRDVEMTLRSRILLWTKARRLFPELASRRTVNALLAPTYLHLGFVVLDKGSRREARQLAFRSLAVSRSPHAWALAVGLVGFTYAGKRAADLAFGIKRRFAAVVVDESRVASHE